MLPVGYIFGCPLVVQSNKCNCAAQFPFSCSICLPFRCHCEYSMQGFYRYSQSATSSDALCVYNQMKLMVSLHSIILFKFVLLRCSALFRVEYKQVQKIGIRAASSIYIPQLRLLGECFQGRRLSKADIACRCRARLVSILPRLAYAEGALGCPLYGLKIYIMYWKSIFRQWKCMCQS